MLSTRPLRLVEFLSVASLFNEHAA
jgi:hypothetical protein